jgi:hypothetical protein
MFCSHADCELGCVAALDAPRARLSASAMA